MNETLILQGTWLTPRGNFEEGFVHVEGNVIRYAGPEGFSYDLPSITLPSDAVILPGFIDLQINGAFGVDVTEDVHAIQTLSRRLPERGVTAFLPTVITSPIARYPELLASADLNSAPDGAQPLGFHLEGPFLNPQRKGAHRPEYICPPSPRNLEMLLDPEKVRLVTLAPEMPGALEAVRALRAAGIVPSAGHSMATYAEARAGFEAGIGYAVHLFNAMPGLHHREPGLIGALLEPGAPPFGIIPDGIHLHPAVIGMIYRARGMEGITLVSDAMAAAGLGAGTHRLGDQDITVDENSARLPDGTLAGSIILLDDAVRNMVRFGVCGLPEAARMASEVPARVLGLTNRKGAIAAGYDADLTVLNGDLTVLMTIIAGKVVYRKQA